MMNVAGNSLETIYLGPRISFIRTFKRFSICSCLLAVLGSPIIIFNFPTKKIKQDSKGKKVGLAIGSISINLLTTILCQRLLGRYVASIKIIKSSSSIDTGQLLSIEKMSLFGNVAKQQVHPADLVCLGGPFAQWKHRATGEKYLVDVGGTKFGLENEQFTRLVQYVNNNNNNNYGRK